MERAITGGGVDVNVFSFSDALRTRGVEKSELADYAAVVRCSKLGWLTKEAARAHIRRLIEAGKDEPERGRLRPYRCKFCSRFHVGHVSVRKSLHAGVRVYMPMTAEERFEAARLIEAVQSDRVQQRLRPGFERDFTNSVLLQWEAIDHLSSRQVEILRSLVARAGGM